MILRNSVLIILVVMPLMSLDGSAKYETQKRERENAVLRKELMEICAEKKNIRDQIIYHDSLSYKMSLSCKEN